MIQKYYAEHNEHIEGADKLTIYITMLTLVTFAQIAAFCIVSYYQRRSINHLYNLLQKQYCGFNEGQQVVLRSPGDKYDNCYARITKLNTFAPDKTYGHKVIFEDGEERVIVPSKLVHIGVLL